MEKGPWLKVSSDRLVKPGIEPGTPGLQDKQFIHYTTAAPESSLYAHAILYLMLDTGSFYYVFAFLTMPSDCFIYRYLCRNDFFKT